MFLFFHFPANSRDQLSDCSVSRSTGEHRPVAGLPGITRADKKTETEARRYVQKCRSSRFTTNAQVRPFLMIEISRKARRECLRNYLHIEQILIFITPRKITYFWKKVIYWGRGGGNAILQFNVFNLQF